MTVHIKPPSVVKSGWLVCPRMRTIDAHVFGGLSSLRYAIQCDYVDCIRTPAFDVWVDDEALMRRQKYFFAVKGYPEPIAGRGFVLGRDQFGRSVSPTITKADLERRILFLQTDECGNFMRVHADRDPTPINLIGVEQWANSK